MIDTDKYEGQTEGLWMMDKLGEIWRADGPEPYCILSVYHKPPIKPSEADLLLMADAPLLLEEVKRLREELRLTKEWLDQLYDEELVSAFRYHVYGED